MKIIETKVYTFEELSKEAKEKAREWYREGNEYYFLEEYMQNILQTYLKDAKISCPDAKISYSLGYSQGDGAMFHGHATWGKYTAVIKQSGHYSHYNSKSIDITYLKVSKGIEEELNAPEDIADKFNELYISICKDLAKAGYEYIEAEDSNENVDDNILANEYTFTETGKRFG